MTVLLLCLLSAAFMAGLSWLISVVHYPGFALVGQEAFGAYHAAHTQRITPVVLVPMATELVTSGVLVLHRPDGVGLAPAVAGLVLAVAAFALTGLVSVPDHARLSRDGLDVAVVRRLVRGHHLRTAVWSAHAALLCLMAGAAA